MPTKGKPKKEVSNIEKKEETQDIVWGATTISKTDQISTFDNKSITYKGEIKGFDYERILKDKQKYINDLYALSDYFCDKDQIYRGIIKNVYVPFSLSSGWKLVGANEKTRQKYLDFYKSIGFGDICRSIFLQYHKYENVYVYLMEDGHMITLPVHKVRVADISVNGEPVVELNVSELKTRTAMSGSRREDFIKTLLKQYDGYPKEVKEAITQNKGQWVQLNPTRTFCLTGLKEDWIKYAIPMVSACLEPFAKKTLISSFENSQLSLGMRGFLHIKVGSKDLQKIVNQEALNANVEIFKAALSGFPLAVTNWMVDAEWKNVDTKSLFDKNKYAEVNADILSAGGIAAVVVSGNSQGSTSFASAQVSVESCAQRIKQATDNFTEMMNKINLKLADVLKVTSTKIPEFKFNPIDLTNNEKFKETCFKLWQQGCISTQTLLEENGFNKEQELERKKNEIKNKDNEVFVPPSNPFNQAKESNNNPDNPDGGAPEKDLKDRKTDPNSSKTGKQPKPSTE